MKEPHKLSAPAMLACLVLQLGACAPEQAVVGPSGPDQKPSADAPNALQITDIPLPAGAKLDAEHSLIIGSSDRWLGRLVIKTESSPIQAFNHFYTGMSAFGWHLITAVQGRISSLTFLRGDRVALIQIEASSLGGLSVSITVSPRQPDSQDPARPKR